MFKEFKPSSAAGRLSSPLLRRRAPTVGHQYITPQNSRKSRILGIGRLKKKTSVPENLISRVDSSDSAAMSTSPCFAEDPRNIQIKEQVQMCVIVCCCCWIILYVSIVPAKRSIFFELILVVFETNFQSLQMSGILLEMVFSLMI